MAYLAKDRKADLRYIAEKLGERVTDDLKTIHIKNLIINSTNYEEEFARKMLNAILQERRKNSTSHVCENYDAIKKHNSNPFELQKLSKCNAKQNDKIEIAENIAENMENLLLSFIVDKDSINVIKINANEFIEAQQKSEELAALNQKNHNKKRGSTRRKEKQKMDRKKRVIEFLVEELPFTKMGSFYNSKGRQNLVPFDPGVLNGFQPTIQMFHGNRWRHPIKKVN
ncbi:hypothetical protein NPIL_45991 [Nephila pilipes]|uniref:Uncharacterized protein n=1 Tax=Nephila pilipes TaxID=299642 RepID=A0A8X6U6N3_NEPPI|nr:hypothetical protein NPIL_45991 [Nephila pilipes]